MQVRGKPPADLGDDSEAQMMEITSDNPNMPQLPQTKELLTIKAKTMYNLVEDIPGPSDMRKLLFLSNAQVRPSKTIDKTRCYLRCSDIKIPIMAFFAVSRLGYLTSKCSLSTDAHETTHEQFQRWVSIHTWTHISARTRFVE